MSSGIHHVTAISGAARRNLAFYAGTLGLRLVKKTVNFDDAATWHLYFGDAAGTPGSLITFFPWEHAVAGRAGVGAALETAFRIPAAATGFWLHRLLAAGVAHEQSRRFGESRLTFSDPDGLRLALVALPGIEREPAIGTDAIPGEDAIRGLHSVVLLVADAEPTAAVLTGILGFAEGGHDDGVLRCRAPGDGPGRLVDLREGGGFIAAREGRGSVHHIAFRTADATSQAALAEQLVAAGLHPTEVKDRKYFRSIYFREPGGILFEIATDGPGFAVDEPADALGEALTLPESLEPRRDEIAKWLPDLSW